MVFTHAWLQSLHHCDCASPWATISYLSPPPDCKPEDSLRAGLVLLPSNLIALWQGPGLEQKLKPQSVWSKDSDQWPQAFPVPLHPLPPPQVRLSFWL